ncbi:hypothetical protein B0I35DRAFT_363814 [Stachybotrys elegans]|uniref:Azaphilone pigments biosynthesis cluster protein L N-terminal domain-containing protein n=1 Tax=Stachybotrys elegans TaxID=80388 RepID=A0A8K0WK33_9HYPO|nr:hypothetical protein B0I35DRAFT_363814 [Stachybotrys elegans]
MAEVIGVTSGIVALATFAFKSGSKLRDEIQSFKTLPRQVRELLTELSGLTLVLQRLSETGDLGLDVDLAAVRLTLEQCKQACDDVTTELRTYYSQSGLDRASFRDWLKLKCSGGDGIEGFRQQLIGYKSTITVALSFANLRASNVSVEAIQACRDSIATSTIDLETHLEDILQKLESFTPRAIGGPNHDAVTRSYMEKERLSTEKALQFCMTIAGQMEQIQTDFQKSQDPDSASGMLFAEGLEGCMHHMRFTLANLEEHKKKVGERLSTGLDGPSAEDQASFTKLQDEAKTLRRCLAFCSDVDAYVESKISNIENHAEGDDTIQFMVSTDGRPLNGKNHGTGNRQKQAGGHFGEISLQQVSRDFKSIAIHQNSYVDHDNKHIASMTGDDAVPASPKSPFGDRHGPGFMLAKGMTPPNSYREQ